MQNLAELEKLAKLKTIELIVPASMALETVGMKTKRHITKVWIHVSTNDRLRIPADYKFVNVVFQ